MNSRRSFLKTSAGLAASLAVSPLAKGVTEPAATLPKVKFGDMEISRLIIGQNTFFGGAHFNQVLSACMSDWYNTERQCQVLLQCQQNGINTYQCNNKGNAQPHMEMFRAQGGKMHLIAIDDNKAPVEETVRRSGAGAVYHHGEVTDVLFREGKMDQVHEYTKRR